MLRVAGELGLNVFDAAAVERMRECFRGACEAALGVSGTGETCEEVRLSLEPRRSVGRVRIRFVTPTELKGASNPEFAVLVARIRDRVSLLKARYGDGPLPLDFRGMAERARAVRMTRCEIQREEATRRSKGTGQIHSIGGFTGVAEYEGELTEFVPYLEAARWTGVGRQTVWGKGEIHCEAD